MRKRALAVLAVLGLVMSTAATAVAGEQQLLQPRWEKALDNDGIIENSLEADRELLRARREWMRHGGEHLPPAKKNMKLLSKLRLTNVEGGVADVHYYKGHAYVAKWAPECPQGGVDVVDVRDPRHPHKVAFLPAGPDDYVGEGVHAIHLESRHFKGDILLVNHEGCGPAAGEGISLWDITDPKNPEPLAQHVGDMDIFELIRDEFGYTGPAFANSVHSVMGFTQCTLKGKETRPKTCNDHRRGFAIMTDNYEYPDDDVDIMNITNPRAPRLISETGFFDWPGVEVDAAGQDVFHHDMMVNAHRPANIAGLSYWDAGHVFLDIYRPSNPQFIYDTNYPARDLLGFSPPEGNAHQGEWSKNAKWFLGSDEDFSPYRAQSVVVGEGEFPGAEFGWTVPMDQNFADGTADGNPVYGGHACDPATVPQASAYTAEQLGEDKILGVSRGGCFFSIKVENAQNAGWEHVVIANHHAGSAGGRFPDAYLCGSMGHDFTPTISATCTGHRWLHVVFDVPPNYEPNVDASPDMEAKIGQVGDETRNDSVFDGWGYLNQYNFRTGRWKDAYATNPTLSERRAACCGVMSIHEIETDRRFGYNLGYISWYAVGMKVVKFGKNGIKSRGIWRDRAGNDFWGVALEKRGQKRPIIYGSDRSYGLFIFKYTGRQ